MLEEPDSIDMITQDRNGLLWFTIVDAGITTDPEERYRRLTEKLRTYLGFIMSPDFETQHPGVHRAAVMIRVMSPAPPTPAMAEIRQIRSRTTPPLEIPVLFELSPAPAPPRPSLVPPIPFAVPVSPATSPSSPSLARDDVRLALKREDAPIGAALPPHPERDGGMSLHDFRFAMTGAIVISVLCSAYLVVSLIRENVSSVRPSRPAPKSSPEIPTAASP